MFSKIVAATLPCAAIAGEHLFSVSTGTSTSFIIDKGFAKASGRNDYGQLGLGNMDETQQFTNITFEDDKMVKQIASGAFHTLIAIHGTGEVYATGRNHKGQLGDKGFTGTDGELRKVLGFDGEMVDTVAAGYAHSVFLMEDGSVLTSGWNHYGQLGHGSTSDSNPPGYVDPFYPPTIAAAAEVNAENATTAAPTPAPPPKAVAIAAGYDFTYILGENGDLWTVGNNLGGQLGSSDGKSRSKAQIALSGVDKIAAGESHGIFLMKDGDAKGTGANFAGQLGDNTFTNKFSPEPILNLEGAKAVAAGGDGSCFAEYQLRCCGSNLLGQLGLRDEVFVALPQSVEEVVLADSMAPGTTHSLFLNHDEVVITGANDFGQLGNNDTDKILRKPDVYRTLTRAEKTTTVPPPTPAPTPSTSAPSPGTSQAASTSAPSRDTNTGPGLDWPWQMLVGGIASGLVVVVVVVCIFDRQPAQVGEPSTVTQSMELRQQEPVDV